MKAVDRNSLSVWIFMVCVVAGALSWSRSATAQTTGSGVIEGRVTDETDAALPGVTITATSPALQLPQVAQATNTEGEYRFVDLPAGIYRLQFELSGFQMVVRS